MNTKNHIVPIWSVQIQPVKNATRFSSTAIIICSTKKDVENRVNMHSVHIVQRIMHTGMTWQLIWRGTCRTREQRPSQSHHSRQSKHLKQFNVVFFCNYTLLFCLQKSACWFINIVWNMYILLFVYWTCLFYSSVFLDILSFVYWTCLFYSSVFLIFAILCKCIYVCGTCSICVTAGSGAHTNAPIYIIK